MHVQAIHCNHSKVVMDIRIELLLFYQMEVLLLKVECKLKFLVDKLYA